MLNKAHNNMIWLKSKSDMQLEENYFLIVHCFFIAFLDLISLKPKIYYFMYLISYA